MLRQLTAHDVNEARKKIDERRLKFILGPTTTIKRTNAETSKRERRHLDHNLEEQRSSLSSKSAHRPMHHNERNMNGRQNKQRNNSNSRRHQKALNYLSRMHGKSIPPLEGRNQSRVSGLGNSSRTTLGESLRNQRVLGRRPQADPRQLHRFLAILHCNGCTSTGCCEAAAGRQSHMQKRVPNRGGRLQTQYQPSHI